MLYESKYQFHISLNFFADNFVWNLASKKKKENTPNEADWQFIVSMKQCGTFLIDQDARELR